MHIVTLVQYFVHRPLYIQIVMHRVERNKIPARCNFPQNTANPLQPAIETFPSMSRSQDNSLIWINEIKPGLQASLQFGRIINGPNSLKHCINHSVPSYLNSSIWDILGQQVLLAVFRWREM